jgi:branched-chain amino acid transport system permease protein
MNGSTSFRSFAERAWPAAALVALVLVAYDVVAWLGSDQLDRVATTSAINLLIVVSLYMFIGNSGVFSFGHMAFAAIGAYSTALCTIPVGRKKVTLTHSYETLIGLHLGTVPALLVAGLIAAVFAAVIAVPLMRLSGIAAGLATFAVLVIVNVVANNWKGVTNAASGMNGIPTVTSLGNVLPWVVVAIVVAYLLQTSRTGRRLRASREDEVASRALGIGVFNERRVAFVASAFFSGVAGGLLAQYLGSFTANNFYLNNSFIVLAMLVVGGMNSLSGAVVGVMFISIVQELLLRVQDNGVHVGPLDFDGRPGLQQMCLAAIMLAVLIKRPSGLTGNREWPLPRFRRRRQRTETLPAESPA